MIITAVILIVFAIAIKYGKMYFLIAGYNTMDKEKQAQYKIEDIATLFKNVMFGISAVILIGYGLAHWLANPQIAEIAFFGAILIGVPYLLIASNSSKYKK